MNDNYHVSVRGYMGSDWITAIIPVTLAVLYITATALFTDLN